jgi:hypothetical protein
VIRLNPNYKKRSSFSGFNNSFLNIFIPIFIGNIISLFICLYFFPNEDHPQTTQNESEIVIIQDSFKVEDMAILKLTGEEVILVSKSWNYPRMWWVRTTYKDIKNSLIAENEDGLLKKNN